MAPSLTGSTISHYRILEKLGEGGMGVVYKAQDLKLDRLVALKFLPTHLSTSANDKARLMHEARAASAINHPNVCTIYSIDEHEGHLFIAMEFVDEQSLYDRKGSMSLRQAVDIGIQIADGLAAAHEKGIVHRDIKPENVILRKDGVAQITDFGLAKVQGVSRLTREGSTVGTAAYMSPEQVEGREADQRSDIFSLGVLLYEMFTGKLPFNGAHETALLYEIVNVDPRPMSAIKPDIHPSLDALVLECLQKDANERTQSVRQVSVNLKRFKRESGNQAPGRGAIKQHGVDAPRSLFNRYFRPALITAIVSIIGMLAFAVMYFTRPDTEVRTLRFSIMPPEKGNFYSLGAGAGQASGGPVALSLDGRRLTFVATSPDGKRHLWIRSLDQLSSQMLPATDNASYPFWSPDNRFIGFFADGKLKKIDASGGPPFTICNAPDARGATWNNEGVIVFTPGTGLPLSTVPSAGGSPAVLTQLDTSRDERSHRWPSFLPDGRHFLYFVRVGSAGSQNEGDGVYLGSLDGKVNRRLLSTHANALYASGHLLFMRGATLMAQAFSLSDFRLTGDPVPLVEQISYDFIYSKIIVAASATGVLAYQSMNTREGTGISLLDRNGKPENLAGEASAYYDVRFSPDERKIAAALFDQQSRNLDIWLYDIARKARTRFTFDSGIDRSPVWSPDGTRIVFRSNRKKRYDIYQKVLSGAGVEESLFESMEDKVPTDWSPDGRFVIYYSLNNPTTREDVWVLPMFGDRKPIPVLHSEFSETFPRISPDGKWLAYQSDETGSSEVYVRRFLGPGGQPATGDLAGKWQISTAGGRCPVWGRNGKEIFFLNANDKLMVANVIATGLTIDVRTIAPLLETRVFAAGNAFDVSGDGRSILVDSIIDFENSSPVIVVVNWPADLKSK